MNKTEFLSHGFYVVERPHHLIVSTPQTFISGDPASFCVKKSSLGFLFCDYGMAHNALELSLPNSNRADDIIKQQIDRLQSPICLVDYALIYETSQMQMGIEHFINLFALLTTYKPRLAQEYVIDEFLDCIRQYLLNRFGTFDEKVRFKGLSGAEYRFAFASNDQVFEFARPSSQNTGTLLRKIHDVKLIHDDLTFSIFLDDSDKKIFDRESRILSSVSNIKPTSMLVA